MLLTVAVIVYIICCVLTGYFGRLRRMGFFGTFLLSLLITPLVVLLILGVTGPSPGVEWRRRPPRQ